MTSSFYDANIFIKYFIFDSHHPDHSPRCRQLIKDLKNGRIEAYTTVVTIIETATVLQRAKVFDRETIALDLLNLIDLDELHIRNKPTLRKSLLIFMKGTGKLSLADAYTIAEALEEKINEVTTYDSDFDQFENIDIKRLEP